MNIGHLDYQSAVEQAKEFIEDNRFHNGFDMATPEGYKSYLTDYAARYAACPHLSGWSGNIRTGEAGEFDDQETQSFWYRYVEGLIIGAETDAQLFQAVLLRTASDIEEGAVLHPKLRKWIVQYLRGEVSPPPKPKGRMESTGLHILIAHAVGDLVGSGMQPTSRGDASPAVSACDAVADALAQLKINSITFKTVKRIWFDCDKSQWIG